MLKLNIVFKMDRLTLESSVPKMILYLFHTTPLKYIINGLKYKICCEYKCLCKLLEARLVSINEVIFAINTFTCYICY